MGCVNTKELRKLVNFCRKNGIISFQNSEFAFKLSLKALKLPKFKLEPTHKTSQYIPTNVPDLTFWSAPDMGDVVAENQEI